MLRLVKNGETIVANTVFNNGNAKVLFTVSAKKPNIPEHVGEVTFDFADVSADQIKQLAVDSLTIKLQSRLRTAFKAKKDGGSAGMLKAGAANTIKVADFLTVRARVDKVEKGKKLIAGMSAEQRKALLAELTGKKA